jgi:hypothetical protein
VANVDIQVEFSPPVMKAFWRNEVQMLVTFKNAASSTYWSECEIKVLSPLSLSPDSEMNTGRTRIGILKPFGSAKKTIRLYTRPNNYPDEYQFTITAFVYDEDGAIAERVERKAGIVCAAEAQAQQTQQQPQSQSQSQLHPGEEHAKNIQDK